MNTQRKTMNEYVQGCYAVHAWLSLDVLLLGRFWGPRWTKDPMGATWNYVFHRFSFLSRILWFCLRGATEGHQELFWGEIRATKDRVAAF